MSNTNPEKSKKKEEFVLKGIPASPGIAIGDGFVYSPEKTHVEEHYIHEKNVEANKELFRNAQEIISNELERLKNKEIDQSTVDILDAQLQMVNDPDLESRVFEMIEKKLFAVDYALQEVFDSYLSVIEQSENKIIKERLIDMEDVRDRMIQVASKQSVELDIDRDCIVVAEELGPREIIVFSDFNLKALITDHGGRTSHASIIARSMGIPSVVGVKRASQLARKQDRLIVDGNNGIVIINPDETLLKEYSQRLSKQKKVEKELRAIVSKPSTTADDVPFTLRANIEFSRELSHLKKYGAEGIGLLRTESIYMRKRNFDNRDRQIDFYTDILEKTGDQPVTIRLFDAGGDKFFSFSSEEKNPFLGWRGIRMLLDERYLLREQLKAILEVALQYPGRIKILIPMISVLDELFEVYEELETIAQDFSEDMESLKSIVQLGIMVEVPSVALQAGEFARHVDFFSIGTNDLTQYTLAVDRGNELISDLYQQKHPAVWKLIRMTVEAAERDDIDVAICGEIASEPSAAACLMGLGIRDLSMSPAAIPRVKNLLTQHSVEEMKNLAGQVLDASTISEVKSALKSWNNNLGKHESD